MNIDAPSIAARINGGTRSSQQIEKEQAAVNFEKIFARQLVKEMTKDSFKMSDNNSMMGGSNNMYRKHITDALAGELAEQRKLGMADLVMQYWNQDDSEY